MTTKYDDMVWKILCGMPIEVFDEDDDTVWENETWEFSPQHTNHGKRNNPHIFPSQKLLFSQNPQKC